MARDYPDRPIVGIGCILWRGERLLMIRRGQPPRVGQWSLPGGAQELGETIFEAAAREVMEETGLTLKSPEILTALDMIDRDAQGRTRYHYTLIDVMAEAGEGEARAGSDAAALAWMTPEEALALPIWEETRRIIKMAVARRSGCAA